MNRMAWLLAFAPLVLTCRSHPAQEVDAGAAPAVTPVSIAQVSRADLEVVISGPGRTDVIEQQKVTAPFNGLLESVRVVEGDHVRNRQVVATILSQNSVAALQGARVMLQSAQTPGERSDAERALELANRGAVRAPLRAPEAGVVVKRSASEGDLVSEHQEILSIAATDSIVFLASIVQTDLAQIHPGEHAKVDIASSSSALTGVVHGILPAASSKDLTAPVRIDFEPAAPNLEVGIFGTAHIVVAEHRSATVVPVAAVLRNDVTGVSRVALVEPDNRVHWVDVTTGIQRDNQVEIVAPPLMEGQRVVVEGQVGLPEGATVATAS